MKRIPLIIISVISIVMLTCGAASAKWIDFDSGQVDPPNAYKIKFPNYPSGLNVRIGEHLLDFEQTEGAAPEIFKDVASYCIEDQVVDYIPREYTIRTVNAQSDQRDKKAAWIYKQYGSIFQDDPVTDDQKRYNQAAIWNVFMDNDYDLGNGDVQVLNNNGILNGANNVLTELQDFIDNYGFGNYDFSGVLIATNPDSQDFITADLPLTPSAVPIPGAVWLLGSGLVGLVGLRARKRRS